MTVALFCVDLLTCIQGWQGSEQTFVSAVTSRGPCDGSHGKVPLVAGFGGHLPPTGAEIGLLEAGAKDVAIAGVAMVRDAFAGLDEEQLGPGVGGVDDAAVEQG